MPRRARIESGTGIFHVMMRGINHQNIFEDEEDCWQFISTLDRMRVRYNDDGHELERVTITADSGCRAVQVPRNVYHTFIPHEDGTAIFEAKDRAYDPDGTEEFLEKGDCQRGMAILCIPLCAAKTIEGLL